VKGPEAIFIPMRRRKRRRPAGQALPLRGRPLSSLGTTFGGSESDSQVSRGEVQINRRQPPAGFATQSPRYDSIGVTGLDVLTGMIRGGIMF